MAELRATANSAKVPQHGYDFARLSAVEDRHFWFRSRNRLISDLVSQVVHDLPPGYRVLEVGCGNGNVLRYLERACTGGSVVGLDPFPDGLETARQRVKCSLVQADAGLLPFTPGFQVIGVFDVLEHLVDDRSVLDQMFALLAPEGVLLLTVPAHQWLWSYFDEASQHVRRYELPDLQAKLEAAGFQIEFISKFMGSLVPLMWLQRRLFGSARARRRSAGELARQDLRIVPVVNGILAFFLRLESRLIVRRRRLPIGCSLVAVAKRPNPVRD